MKNNPILFFGLLIIATGCKNIAHFHAKDSKIDVTISSVTPARFNMQTAGKEQWLTTPFSFTIDESIAFYRFISINPKQKLTMQVSSQNRKTMEVSAAIITLDKNKEGLRGSGSGSN